MTAPVRIAIAGVGGHGAVILDAAAHVGALRIVACLDVDAAAAEAAARRFGCEAAASFDEVADNTEIEAVVLATPNHVHREQAVRALRAGKDVFVEKPLALNVEAGRDIISAARISKKIVQVGYNMRKRAGVARVRELISSGSIGTLVACHGTFAHDQVTIAGVPAWKTDPQLCPLLPVTQLGSHIIDIMELIAGPVDFVACAAQANFIRGPSGDPVDTTASLMQFTGGVVGTLQSHYIVPDRYELEFHGTRGWLVLEGHRLTEAERTLGGLEIREETFDEAPLASFMAELEEFAGCVRGRNQPSSDAQAALQTLAVVEAMDLSVREHRIVHVSEIALSGAS